MKLVKKLSLFAVAIIMVGCNEKVSPELQQANSASDPTGPVVLPSEFYFKLSNTSNPLYNYKMHKTGEGNASAECKISDTTRFRKEMYPGGVLSQVNGVFKEPKYDITCYMDAEELSLSYGGFKMKIEASPNTCDYVAYTPFSYYDRIPGDSTGTYTQVTCSTDTTTATHAATVATAIGMDITYNGGANTLGCNSYLSNSSLLASTRQPFQIQSDQDLCRFNYKDGENEQCDIGTITVNELQVAYTISSDPGGTTTLTHKLVKREIQCGGDAYNCVRGPIKKHTQLKSASSRIVSATEVNTPYAYEVDYPGNDDFVDYRNYRFANYRRDLANPEIAYGTAEHSIYPVVPYNGTYLGAWTDMIYGKTFNALLMERYAKNLNFNGSENISSGVWTAHYTQENSYTAKPLAAEPYLGMIISSGGRQPVTYQTNPYYAFHCLDNAREVTARIRLLVRDFDRVFPSNTSNTEYLSDIFNGVNARQDLQDFVEDTDNSDPFNFFNDSEDWDDLMQMERYISGGVIRYRPLPALGYPNGFFNPDIFPNDSR